MESKLRIESPEKLMLPLLELVDRGETVPLVISGGSMTPFLVHGRDTVYLSRVSRPLKKGDMILYRRESGDYVLHRICRVRKETFDLIGDAQRVIETGIRQEQILALVTAVRRKGVLLQGGSFLWDFFEKAWIRMVPLRPMMMGLYRTIALKLEKHT